jgi:peptide/nickel transport system permease protein
MSRYIIRRLLQLIPVLFGISLITFVLSFIVPGDPVRAIMGQRSDRETELRIREKLGLDRPWYVQYGIWVRNLIRNPGGLPQFKLRSESDDGGEIFTIKFTPDTVFASDGVVRPITDEPFRGNVLTHLIQRGCGRPDNIGTSEGGTTRKVVEISLDENPPRIQLEDFQGLREWFFVDENLDVCSDDGSDQVKEGEPYSAYFRSEGFQAGREFTAIFSEEDQEVVDAMYDDASSGATEIRTLQTPVQMTLTGWKYRAGRWIVTLKNPDGEVIETEMMSNAVLLLGGNRSELSDFTRGISINVAFTNRIKITPYAVFDGESEGMVDADKILQEHPDAIEATGTITDIILNPAVWFDFGRSYRQQREVRDIIHDSFKNTAYLSIVAMLIAIIVGIFSGVVSAVKPYSFIDYLTMTAALIGVSMPVFWLGLMLILLFQGQLGWVTGIGFGEITWHEVNLGLFSFHLPWHQNVVLPAITLATVPMAIIARMTRSSMLEVMNLDYIRTARAKGVSRWNVIVRHALKNSLIPIITVIGVDFALLLAGAVLTETVFSWPGLGREIVDAITFRDFPIVMAGVVLFAFIFVMVNLVVDILYAFVDPRIRYQ